MVRGQGGGWGKVMLIKQFVCTANLQKFVLIINTTYHEGMKDTSLSNLDSEYIWQQCDQGARRRVRQGLSQVGAELIDTVAGTVNLKCLIDF